MPKPRKPQPYKPKPHKPKLSFSMARSGPKPWKLLECRTGNTFTLDPSNREPFVLGSNVSWHLCFQQQELYLERTVSHYAPLVVNSNAYGEEDRYSIDDFDFTIVVKDEVYGIAEAWFLFRPRPTIKLPPTYRIFRNPDEHRPGGPFQDWDNLTPYINDGNFPADAMVTIEGNEAWFKLEHLRGQFGAAPPPPPQPTEPPPPPVEPPPPEVSKEFISAPKNPDGKLVCLYCRERFDEGEYYYFPEHPDLMNEPPAAPADWDIDGHPLDAKGIACVHRACPHCGGRLPKSFGPETEYTIISLVGQTHTGKSYYIGTMGRGISPALTRNGIDMIDDDAELNLPFVKLCNIPFTPTPLDDDKKEGEEWTKEDWRWYRDERKALLPEELEGKWTQDGWNRLEAWRRYINKTDETQATQSEIYHREGEDGKMKVPKPFILRLVDQSTGGMARLVLYDNAGEDFTQVEHGQMSTRKGRIASGHLAHAKFVMVLYDPTIDPEFCAALATKPELDDIQRTMLTTMADQMHAYRSGHRLSGPSEVPLAVMVGKSDAWAQKLAPELNFNCYNANGHLNMATVQQNSAILNELLERKLNIGIPAAARAISKNVCYFPVSALGSPPVPCHHPELGVKVNAPRVPAKPQGVEVPILWGLWKIGLIGDDEEAS